MKFADFEEVSPGSISYSGFESLSVAVFSLEALSQFWSTSESYEVWHVHSLSIDELDHLRLDPVGERTLFFGDRPNEPYVFEGAGIAAWNVCYTSWMPGTSAVISVLAQMSDWSYSAYEFELDLTIPFCADHLVLRRTRASALGRTQGLPLDFLGPSNAGHLVSRIESADGTTWKAYSMLAANDAYLIGLSRLPEPVRSKRVISREDSWTVVDDSGTGVYARRGESCEPDMSMDHRSGALIVSAENCAVIAYYD